MLPQPLIINNWQQGMADSPYLGIGGFGLMKSVNIEEIPGSLKCSKAMRSLFHDTYTSVFTAVAATDICTSTATIPRTYTAVTLTTTGTLPAGLSTGTNYFIIKINATTFKLATTLANARTGTQIDITDTGTGVHTITTVDPGTIRSIVKDVRINEYFAQDSNGRVWYGKTSAGSFQLLNGNTLTGSAGKGLVLLKPSSGDTLWLFVFRNAKIDVVNVYGDNEKEAPTWTNDWQTTTTPAGTGNSHYAIQGQDNIIYYCDTFNIGSIKETTGPLDPANAATYSFNSSALDLPKQEIANWLEELETNLLIAGNSFNKIYPWDRLSDTFSLPIVVPESSVKFIKNLGDKIYILAGTRGNIYSTQGVTATFERKIPEYASNNSEVLTDPIVTWGGIASKGNGIIIGAGCSTTASSGIWILYPDGRILKDNEPASGATNATCLFADSDYYLAGYASGCDVVNAFDPTARVASYASVVQSELYNVSTKTLKATYSTLEVQLGKPAASGNIRIGYRSDTSSAFTTLHTIACDGSTSYVQAIGLQNIENIQIQVEMDGIPDLLQIRLLP